MGPVGIVLIILAYVGKQWLSSDGRYKDEIDRLKEDIEKLRADVARLSDELDEERRLRFEAQEEAHRIRLKAMRIDYDRSEEHTSELQSREKLVCRRLLEKKNCLH